MRRDDGSPAFGTGAVSSARGFATRRPHKAASWGHDPVVENQVDPQPRRQHGEPLEQLQRVSAHNRIDLAEGTLYPALHRLERAGLVSGRWSEVSGRRRRIDRLTAKGERSLTQKHREWDLFARTVYTVVGSRP